MADAVFPQVAQVAMLNSILEKAGAVTGPLVLRLYSNNRTPARTDVAGDYDEVSGGGYTEQSLDAALFTVSAANPSVALYDDFIAWTFTGATDSPGTVYGAYIVDANGVLISAQLFLGAPYEPVNTSVIRYKPRITLASDAP